MTKPNGWKMAGALLLLLALFRVAAWSESYKVLYNFSSQIGHSTSGLITDAAGNAYGTGVGGFGDDFAGIVYELSPTTGYHLLYQFSNTGPSGWVPQGNLAIDSTGNLYGTTQYGGVNCPTTVPCGVVFELSPSPNGGLWTETVLHSFCYASQSGCTDGAGPQAGVIFDLEWNLYGTTMIGGGSPGCDGGCGTVFELQDSSSGWVESILYSFTGMSDGFWPTGSLVFGTEGVLAGNLYGTVQGTRPTDGGAVFQLAPIQGSWAFTVIHAFEGNDGCEPAARLVFGARLDLFGTTSGCGQFDGGTVFELVAIPGSWQESTLHNFGNGSDGATPESNLVMDSEGNLYGTTAEGGGTIQNGTVFKLAKNQAWEEYLFQLSGGANGSNPAGSVTLDQVGDVYGTTTYGGSMNAGVVFKITQ